MRNCGCNIFPLRDCGRQTTPRLFFYSVLQRRRAHQMMPTCIDTWRSTVLYIQYTFIFIFIIFLLKTFFFHLFVRFICLAPFSRQGSQVGARNRYGSVRRFQAGKIRPRRSPIPPHTHKRENPRLDSAPQDRNESPVSFRSYYRQRRFELSCCCSSSLTFVLATARRRTVWSRASVKSSALHRYIVSFSWDMSDRNGEAVTMDNQEVANCFVLLPPLSHAQHLQFLDVVFFFFF